MEPTDKPKKLTGRGGPGRGQGRPSLGHVALTCRITERADRIIRRLAAESGQQVGAWLSRHIESLEQ